MRGPSEDSPNAPKPSKAEGDAAANGGGAREPGRWKRWVVALLGLGLLGVLSGVAGLGAIFWYYGRDVSAIDEAALRNYRPPQVTRVLDREGRLIGELFSERRTVIPFEEIPGHVEDAFLAAEDADFRRHRGMDFMGMARALVTNVKAGRIKQGASTITQQVVKNFLLSPERSFERKVQELILARRLEDLLDKNEILGLYLNSIYLGHGRYGIEEASRYYFGKSVRDIDVGQAAVLATLPKAPSRDSPYKQPETAKRRQVFVLQQMVEKGFLERKDIEPFLDAPLDVVDRSGDEPAEGSIESGAEEIVDLVRTELEARYGAEDFARLGAVVHTTIDLELQRKARAALVGGLRELDVRRSFGHGIRPAKKANLERAHKKGAGELEWQGVYPVVIVECPEGMPTEGFCGHIGDQSFFVRVPEGSRYDDPKKSYAEQFPPQGITMARVLVNVGQEGAPAQGWGLAEIGSGPEAALVLADVERGEVLAMVGGSAYERGGFNRVVMAKRQPGSSFKPMVYGAALDSRGFTPATLVADSPEIYEKWRPTNFERDVYRGDIRLRVALTHSVNTVAIKLLDAVGFPAVQAFAKAAGIDSPLADNLSLALGTSEVSPYELLAAYLTLARGGSRLDPIVISKVEVPGESEWLPERTPTEALDPAVVFTLTSMMTSVVEEGTARKAKALGRPAAGKTGTSGDNKDAWFAGFTPQLVAVAWVGFDTPRSMRGETGGRAALPIWLGAMKAGSKDLPVRAFEPPPSVVVRRIDAATGLLAPEGAAGDTTLEEYFVEGTEPVEYATPAVVEDPDAVLDLYDDSADPSAPAPAPSPDAGPSFAADYDGDDQLVGPKSKPGADDGLDSLPSLDDEL